MRNMVLHFPSKLTDLEEELQLKYAKLRRKKKQLLMPSRNLWRGRSPRKRKPLGHLSYPRDLKGN